MSSDNDVSPSRHNSNFAISAMPYSSGAYNVTTTTAAALQPLI